MLLNRLVIVSILWVCAAHFAFAAECGSSPPKAINLDLVSTRSLSSPDQLWRFISVGPNSPEHKAELYIQRNHSSQKWNVGSIARDGTVFWSEDSKRLFLRDEFAADDMRIRVFEVTGPIPKVIKGLNGRIQQAIFSHIPSNKTTQWQYFPKVCFAANDSSTIVLVADAPLVPKRESGSGKPSRLRLTVNLTTLQIVTTNYVEQRDDST
jgi:hypothetical protein